MNQNTTISIVIAVYNIEKYLDKCLKSIKEQVSQDRAEKDMQNDKLKPMLMEVYMH